MKILVLDGNSIINRAFYGIRPLTTKDGIFTNAIFGFVNILFKLQEQVQPDVTVAAFDLKAPTFRHKMFDEYKAGRKPMPAELASQFPYLKELLPNLGVSVVELEGYEADDILGTLSKTAEEQGNECFIATGDRDSLQLVSDSTTVLLAATKMGRPELRVYNKEVIKEEYGIKPIQLIDVKALMGDSSDNIPGVGGIGQKTALDLVQKFQTVENLYKNIDSPDIRESVRTKLVNDKENADLSYTLGTIFRDVPISRNFDDYKIKNIDKSLLFSQLAKLEFFKFIEKLGLSAENVGLSVEKSEDVPQKNVVDEIDLSGDEIYFTWEMKNGVLSICVLKNDQLCIISDLKKIKEILSTKTVFTHDIKGLYEMGVTFGKVGFDTLLGAYLQNPSGKGYEVDKLCTTYNIIPPTVENAQSDFAGLCQNSACIKSLSDVLLARIKNDGQEQLLFDIEIPLARVLSGMENEGFLVDTKGLADFGEKLDNDIARLQNEIYEDVGYKFNLNSPKQLGEALFVKLGLPAKKKTKNGFSTDAAVLEGLKHEHPAVEKLLNYRQLSKLESTYVDGLLNVVGGDGRIHSTFNQTETRTGRISSSEPNLQNIPVRREPGRELRRFFTAKEGCVLCDADYSQIELRVLASIADDENMIEAFNSGTDIHTSTAAKVFNMPLEMVTPLMRSRAKAVNFGIVYGIGAYSLANDLGISFKEAKAYISGYMQTYNGVAHYMERVVEQAKTDGFVTTLTGRKRLLPEITASNAITRGFGERVARNMPIQGTAADIIKIAMINVYKALENEGLKAKLILQIHDELIIETPIDEVEKVKTLMTREMENAMQLKVPLTADFNSGKTWYDSK